MEAQIRPARPDEMDQLGVIGAYVYAGRYGDTTDNMVSQSTLPDWTLCAFVDGRMVTSLATIPFTARFNGMAAKLGGISAVGTLPEYRRQGFVRRIMQQAIADMRDRGQYVTALWASQAAIYQRYGFAQTTVNVAYQINPQDIQFVSPTPPQGLCRRYSLEDGYPIIRQLYIDFISHRHLYLHRSKTLWGNNALAENNADGPVYIAVYRDADDAPQGYVVYTTRSGKVQHAARGQELVIRDMAWLTSDACLGLWTFIAKHDLVGRVRYATAPPDDPTPMLLQEPRLLHPQWQEGIWLRLTDVQNALATRGYDAPGRLVIEVDGDDLADWNNGVFEVETDGDSAQSKAVASAPDVRLGIRALAALYSGRHSAQTLANWGLLSGEHTAIAAADRLFQSRFAPHCPDHF